MLPSNVWRKEVLELGARRASFAVEAVLPLALALPVLGLNLPGFHVGALLCTLVTLLAAIGAALRAHALQRQGLLERLLLTPASPYRLFVEMVLVRSAIDLLRCLPLVGAVALRYHPEPAALGVLALELLPALLAAELCGVWAASLAGTVSETVTYCVVLLLPALFTSGVFTPADSIVGARAAVAAVLPFTYLHQALLHVLSSPSSWEPRWVVRGGPVTAALWLGVALLMLRRRLRAVR